MQEGDRLYTTAEIMLATGLSRGTVTNRAKLLGFERTGFGYTREQAYQIVTYLSASHRCDRSLAAQLRNELNRMLREDGVPMVIGDREVSGTVAAIEMYGTKARKEKRK